MSANYLHGVETVEVTTGPRPVSVVRAGVIAVVGTDPRASAGMYLIKSAKDAASILAPPLNHFTLRKSIDKIFEQGPATILAINVYVPSSNSALTTNETRVVANGKTRTAFQPDLYTYEEAVAVKNNDLSTTYVFGTDYKIDDYGVITILNTEDIPNGTTLKVTYRRHTSSLVQDSDIIGAYDSNTGSRTGMFLLEEAYTRFGFTAKICIAPVFCERATLLGTFASRANKHRMRVIIDAPAFTPRDQAITGRGPEGDINFNTSNRRLVLCLPHWRITAGWSETGFEYIGHSVFLAGVWSRVINDEGYWVSPSNKEITSSVVPATVLSSEINNPDTDVNMLNEVGICSYFASFGTGYRTWGNRGASWPTNTLPDNFLPVLLTADVIDESIEYAMLPFIDKPITDATIMSIKETVNQFLNTLVKRGAVLPGSECIYDVEENPTEEIALGHLTFNNNYLSPIPAERLTFKRYLATELLANLSA